MYYGTDEYCIVPTTLQLCDADLQTQTTCSFCFTHQTHNNWPQTLI